MAGLQTRLALHVPSSSRAGKRPNIYILKKIKLSVVTTINIDYYHYLFHSYFLLLFYYSLL